MKAVEQLIRHKMKRRGIPSQAIEDFLEKVRLAQCQAPAVPLESVSAPDPGRIMDLDGDPKRLRDLETRGKRLLSHVAVVKLNGGRSTTMGGKVPKGILEVKYGRSYLEIIISQVSTLREQLRVDIPLVLMNSFFTHEPTMEIIGRSDFPVLTFLQNQVPRLVDKTFAPLDTGTEEDWVPPGHGDVYASLFQTGLLDRLRSRGCRWAFISNLDNLAATLEPWILGAIEEGGIDFLLEVTDRTPADRKGGTLVVRNGSLDLLEIAQVASEEKQAFMDINRFKVFNTNNVWVDLDVLAERLQSRSLILPLIQNRKEVMGTRVVQIETAMGAAVGCFPRARGLRVGRDRFFPTKKVEDLFVLQSDACLLNSNYRLCRNPERPKSLRFLPSLVFAPDFLESPEQIYERFQDPSSVSLVLADSLEVSGSVFFEANVCVQGNVRIAAPAGEVYRIPAGTILRDGVYP